VSVTGGGGGVGTEVFKKWNVTDPNASPRQTMTVSIGYGFQFALGDDVKLIPNSGSGELPVMVCPFGIDTIPVGLCIEGSTTPVTPRGARAPPSPTPEESSVILKCSGDFASRICAIATYRKDDNSTAFYGSFTHINECNCPIGNWYNQQVCKGLV
jgi:hypothetical protein